MVFCSIWGALLLAPLVLTLVYSFLSQGDIGVNWQFSTAGYEGIFQYGRGDTLFRTFRIALLGTLIEFVLAFPAAYWIAKRLRSRLSIIVVLVLLTVPFFLSEDARTVVWEAIYARTGPINSLLLQAGIIHHPISGLLFTEASVYLGLIPIYFGNMLFPIWLSMTLIDDEYIEATRDLGGSLFDLMKDIIIPLTAPGIIAGCIFTFVPMLSDTVIPSLLGGGNIVVVSNTIQSLVTTFQYPIAAALSIVITGVVALLLLLLMWSSSLRLGFVRVRR
jgi:ABC-type spermidine/putrescine transport system permease subunit I